MRSGVHRGEVPAAGQGLPDDVVGPFKGIREQRVVYRHALRSALTPVVTQFGIDLGTLLGGIIVTETVFGPLAWARRSTTRSAGKTCR